jgi:lipid-binding SYLF domain-containing protein
MFMSSRIVTATVLCLFGSAILTYAQIREQDEVRDAGSVLREIMSVPERGIPNTLLQEAQAIMIFPNVVKVGLIVGGRHGHGVVLTKNEQGVWGYPVLLTITGGSIGAQIGVDATDLVLMFKTKRGVENIMRGQQLTLGADLSVAAGPVGRTVSAGTDTSFRTEILSWSRSRGLFAGAAVDGSKVKIDHGGNTAFYGRPAPPIETILNGQLTTMPSAANDLRNQLLQLTPPKK